ncbi:MAG: DUF1588 domain-containing protein [Hyphomonadaceae bacterium]|nr:DUF1588 domain-containing protein [Hyphomonadaceae bacterium]
MKRVPLASLLAVIGAVLVCFVGGLGFAQAERSEEPLSTGAPTNLRRLTEAQYRASVNDIFGEVSLTGRFERGLRQDRLIAVGASQQGLSPFSFEQYDVMARGVAAQITAPDRRGALPCAPQNVERFDAACARMIVSSYGERLFRRPLTNAETQRYVGAARAAHQRLGDFYGGVSAAISGLMVAPEFLFRVERTEADPNLRGGIRLDAYSKAVRLSYFLTNSTPDDELLRAAGAGELHTSHGLARQADRLISSDGFETGVRAFFWDMLGFDGFADLTKDAVIYPAFNSRVAADAEEQTLRTIVTHLIRDDGDYRDLFTTRQTHLTRALGIVYRLPVTPRTGWETTEYPEDSGRAGIITDISFLALHSHPGRSSPTIRGMSVREVFLCQTVPPPPPDVDFSVVQDSSNTSLPTARMRLQAHATQPACASCHRLMDPLGLPLENFDGVGTYRARENGAPIDTSGSINNLNFTSAGGLGQALHDTPQTSRCLVNNMYRYAVGRNAVSGERDWMNYLNGRFETSGYRVPELMRTIATSNAFYAVTAESEGGDSTPGGGQ